MCTKWYIVIFWQKPQISKTSWLICIVSQWGSENLNVNSQVVTHCALTRAIPQSTALEESFDASAFEVMASKSIHERTRPRLQTGY